MLAGATFDIRDNFYRMVLGKFSQILKADGKVIVYDWSTEGSQKHVPPIENRFNAEKASEKISNFFNIVERELKEKIPSSYWLKLDKENKYTLLLSVVK